MTGAWPARDPGLQPERTALAWRRTALAVGAGAAVAARLTAPALGALAVVLGVLGGSAAAALWFLAGRRYAVGRPGGGARGGRPPGLRARARLLLHRHVTPHKPNH
ncbi:DUF202 domain-containing protein, partial [Blastococcus sp. SYSU D00820]